MPPSWKPPGQGGDLVFCEETIQAMQLVKIFILETSRLKYSSWKPPSQGGDLVFCEKTIQSMQLVKIFKTVTFKEAFYLYSNSAMVAPGSLHGGPPCLIGGLLHNLKKRATISN